MGYLKHLSLDTIVNSIGLRFSKKINNGTKQA